MKNSSIFSRIGVFPIMLFCTLILLLDAWSIYSVINKGLSRITTWWIIFGGIVALFWAGWHARLIYEKVAFYIFGIRFFLMDISQFAKKEIMIATMFFCLLLDICGTISFWMGYKKFSQDLDNKANKMNKKRLRIFGIILFSIIAGYCLALYLQLYIQHYQIFPIKQLILLVVFSGIWAFAYYIVNKRYKNSSISKGVNLIVSLILWIIFCVIMHFWEKK